MPTLTYWITHSPLFARCGPQRRRDDDASLLHHELLYGTAAQDAFAALFDEVDDFDALAREATQAPLGRELPRRQRGERSRNYDAAARVGRAQARARDGAASPPANPPELRASR